jgi:hypothetical protein
MGIGPDDILALRMQTPQNRLLSALAVALFVAMLLLDCAYCYKRAESRVDSIAYASLTASDTGNTLAQEMADCRSALSGDPNNGCPAMDEPFVPLTMAYSDADYRTFLRFYEVKPAYVFLLKFLYRTLHLSVFSALRTVSVASFLLLGTVLWFWFREHFSTAIASLLALALINTQFVLNMGKALLPDGFSLALLILAAYLLIYLKNKWPGAIVLALLPIARPDNLIFVFFFAALILWRSDRPQGERLRNLGLLAASCAVLQLTIKFTTHSLPWAALFYHSSLGWADPSTYATTHISLRQYLRVLASFGGRALLLQFPLILFFAVLALVGRSTRPLRDLVWASVATEVLRFLLFPSMEERFYTWFLLIGVIAAACSFGEMLKPAAEETLIVMEETIELG